MNYQWYPGHMTKAVRMMKENIGLIDLIIEILDARIPLSSRNPDIDELGKNKFRLVILNKSDLADENINNEWIQYFKEKNIRCVLMDARAPKNVKKIDQIVKEVCKEKIERDRKRGIINRPIRAMVCGIPNVGKSTFINSFSGKAIAKTGNKPGVTKGKQWIRMGQNLELLDTPGILWPKFEDQEVGHHLAYIGSMNDEVVIIDEMAIDLIQELKTLYPGVIASRYSIEETEDNSHILSGIAKARGAYKKGEEPDLEKAASLFMDDYRSGRIGRLSIERP